jgi:hypothetical protein
MVQRQTKKLSLVQGGPEAGQPRDMARAKERFNWGRFACLATTGVGLAFAVLAGIYFVIQLLAPP